MEAKTEKPQAKKRRISVLAQVAIVGIGTYVTLKYLFNFIMPPLPSSIIFMYMAMTLIGLGLFFTVYEEMVKEIGGQVVAFLRGDPRWTLSWRVARWAVLVAIPLYVGYEVEARVVPKFEPPIRSRVIHPAPPREFAQLANPVPKTPENITAGKGMFIAFCSPCHGIKLDGKGPAAKGFNPPPANFVDVGTIAQLQESYLFWRISNGGVGLPMEGEPWNSAMPRWDTRISPENIWKIIMYEFEGSGHKPRTWE